MTSKKQWRKHLQEKQTALGAIKVALGCSRCGYREHPSALHFHHRDYSGSNPLKISQLVRHSGWDAVVGEMQKCDLLCANCHAALHATRGSSTNHRTGVCP
jgi:hypothetical protein